MASWDAKKWAAERASSYNGPKIKFWNNNKTHNGAPTWPWAHRSFIALIEKGLPFEEEIVDLANKPQHFTDMYASIAADPAARAKVPIIEVGDPGSPDYMKMIESGVVTDYIAQRWRDLGPDLLPSDPAKEAKMRFFVQTFMETVHPSNMSFLTARDAQRVLAEHTRFLNGLKATDVALKKHGEQGPGADASFFFGKQYTLAEAQTAPFVIRMAALFQEHRNVDILDTCAQLGFDNLGRWWKAVMERPSTLLTTPAVDSLKQLAPYLRPVFFPYKISLEEQAATYKAARKDWDAGDSRREAELARQAELQRGMKMAEEEKQAKQAKL